MEYSLKMTRLVGILAAFMVAHPDDSLAVHAFSLHPSTRGGPPPRQVSSSQKSATDNGSHNAVEGIPTINNTNNIANGNKEEESFFQSLLYRFQGDFDNYHQVVQDRQQGLLPREGGGHEQIHCLLIPVPPVVQLSSEASTITTNAAGRLAAFYFDGIPERIFRFRYYELQDNDDRNDNNSSVDMTLYCLNPSLEAQLRKMGDPMKWPQALQDFVNNNNNNNDNDNNLQVVTELPNCNVRWTQELDPVQHEYAQKRNDELLLSNQHQQPQDNDAIIDLGIHAVMVHGQAIVESTMMPGTLIRVLDQLSLWQDQFWIHDRGLHPETGAFIYGNQKGVPYQLERVTDLLVHDDNDDNSNMQRKVVNPELQWTLGPSWRTPEEYQDKLDAVGGGVSSQLNRRPAAADDADGES